MENVQSNKKCAICYEEHDELRMLPCWHVACISCVLNMAQTGEGRAVKCHICREPFLFENVRSLPLPVVCGVCKKTATSPKKFPCGPTVYCTECAAKLPEIGNGTILCPVLCKDISHCRNDLLQTKICPICFCMHSSEGLDCGHNICSGCKQELSTQQRNCPLCTAVNAPMPVPANPVLSSNGNAVNAITNIPALDNGQQISQMQLLSALQIIGAWQQRNRHVPRQLTQQQRVQKILEKYIAEDLPKLGIAAALFFIIAIIWGFQFWMWAVVSIALSILRPVKECNQYFWGMVLILISVYSLWNYFFYLIFYLSFEIIFGWVVGVVVMKFFPSHPFFKTPYFIRVMKVIPVYFIFPTLFIHISLVDLGFVFSNYFARPATID